MIIRSGGSGDQHDFQPLTSFAEVHAPRKTVKSFFYTHSKGRHDKQNISDVELALCHPKLNSCQLQTLGGGVEALFTSTINATLFVSLSAKCKIFIPCFNVFQTHLMPFL